MFSTQDTGLISYYQSGSLWFVQVNDARELQMSILNSMIKSRKMRCAEHVARIGEKRNAYRIFVEIPEGKSHWEDQDVGGWTILKLILER
jgi:hypothetical protein